MSIEDPARRRWWERLCWWRDPRWKARRRARREVDRLFAPPAPLLEGTSLRPSHRGRTQVLDVLEDPRAIVFGIVRHPRPHAFSPQSHQVLEVWIYWEHERRLERHRGVNLTRARGEDGEPPGPKA
jgi:hypothetical protein